MKKGTRKTIGILGFIISNIVLLLYYYLASISFFDKKLYITILLYIPLSTSLALLIPTKISRSEKRKKNY